MKGASIGWGSFIFLNYQAVEQGSAKLLRIIGGLQRKQVGWAQDANRIPASLARSPLVSVYTHFSIRISDFTLSFNILLSVLILSLRIFLNYLQNFSDLEH